MRVIIEPDYQQLSRWAAEYVAAKINAAQPTEEHPFKLGCPTGSSPLGLYKHLIDMYKEGKAIAQISGLTDFFGFEKRFFRR